MLPASAPFCRSAAFDLPNSGAFKAPGRRAEAGEAAHMAPAAGEGAGEGDRVKLGGRRWTQASPSLGIPSHPTGMLQVEGAKQTPGWGGGEVSSLGLKTTHST